MKDTLKSKCGYLVEPHLRDGVIPADAYKEVIGKIHTEVVSDVISNRSPNRVLNAPTPDISAQETFLPRPIRATLAQLRSGHCAKLNDYQLRIGKVNSDICPECNH